MSRPRFPTGEGNKSYRSRLATASWANKPVFPCSTFQKINCLPQLFSLSVLPWMLASLMLLIFCMSQCLEVGDKSPTPWSSLQYLCTHTDSQQKSPGSWSCCKGMGEMKWDLSPSDSQQFQHLQHRHLSSLLPWILTLSFFLVVNYFSHSLSSKKKDQKPDE